MGGGLKQNSGCNPPQKDIFQGSGNLENMPLAL